jgi:hypothetical protein
VSAKGNYTKEELAMMLAKIDKLSEILYWNAVQIGCHPFIEFVGLINEWKGMARLTMDSGEDFTLANTHTGQPLRAHSYQVEYLAEKFDCIFGPLLAQPEQRKIFFEAMGWPEEVKTPERPADGTANE